MEENKGSKPISLGYVVQPQLANKCHAGACSFLGWDGGDTWKGKSN